MVRGRSGQLSGNCEEMRIANEEILITKEKLTGLSGLREYYFSEIKPKFPSHIPIRFVITETKTEGYLCEIDFVVLEKGDDGFFSEPRTIFDFRKRSSENIDKFIAAMIIPTGIGAEIGGHCGDGNVAARLLASACDTLITHPNVVNASDINEMTENTLYIEGSILTQLFMGKIGIQKVRSNRILMLMDKSKDAFFNNEIINAVSSARVTLGIECDVLEMEEAIESHSIYTKSGRAAGNIEHLESLFETISKHRDSYDAIGLATIIDLPKKQSEEYFKTEQEVVNPWGGIEAIITHSVAAAFQMPCAHSPLSGSMDDIHLDYDLGVVDPRKAPETASVTYLHCILKGLHKSPRITSFDNGLNVKDISCLVIPNGCIGLPVLACLEHNIPVIAVKNQNRMQNDLQSLPFRQGQLFYADNYLEATGIMTALKAGVSTASLSRPIRRTNVLKNIP